MVCPYFSSFGATLFFLIYFCSPIRLAEFFFSSDAFVAFGSARLCFSEEGVFFKCVVSGHRDCGGRDNLRLTSLDLAACIASTSCRRADAVYPVACGWSVRESYHLGEATIGCTMHFILIAQAYFIAYASHHNCLGIYDNGGP